MISGTTLAASDTDPSRDVGGALSHLPRPLKTRTLVVVAISGIPAAVYFLFVLHFSINVIFWDEWSNVPIIDAALHSHLTLGLLWTQHNENRILLPNLVVVASSLVQDYNSKSIILLSALIFIASYLFVLAAFRSYVGRPLTVMHSLTLGLVWFSLEDTENSLWGFQLAWYMVLFFLVILVFLFAHERRHRKIVLAVAVLASVAASFSSLQGLLLWPIGLMCLVWPRPRDRRRYIECGVWLAFGTLTSAIYFRGFNFQVTGGGGSPGFALRHPVEVARFLLAELGNLIPTIHADLLLHEIIGVPVLFVAAFVVARCVRDRKSQSDCPLPLTLILFGVLFDCTTALGRLKFGLLEALSLRYTMANLLVLFGIVAYAWAHVPSGILRRGVTQLGTRRTVALALLTIFFVVQVAIATGYGLTSARTTLARRIIAAQTIVNLDRISSSEGQAYVAAVVYPNLTALDPYLQEAESDHISVFAPGPYRFYREKGPPIGAEREGNTRSSTHGARR